jgi:hypothetical protein
MTDYRDVFRQRFLDILKHRTELGAFDGNDDLTA